MTDTNTLNLHNGCFLSADADVELSLVTPVGVKLMAETGSKLADHQLKTVGDGKYYVAQVGQAWAMVPVRNELKWVNNQAYALLEPLKETLTLEEWDAL